MSSNEGDSGSSFFGSFPARGVWTALGLSRAWFFSILAISIVAFLFIDGAVWNHLEDNHFRRIVISYMAIPGLITVAQLSRGRFDLPALLGGAVVIGALKLLVTALVVLYFSI